MLIIRKGQTRFVLVIDDNWCCLVMSEDKRPTENIKLSELVRDYLKNCSIHGLQYLLHDGWTV